MASSGFQGGPGNAQPFEVAKYRAIRASRGGSNVLFYRGKHEQLANNRARRLLKLYSLNPLPLVRQLSPAAELLNSERRAALRHKGNFRDSRLPSPHASPIAKGTPSMRNAVACVACRVAKRQCITTNERPPCQRCKNIHKADTCRFPAPGTSSQHRQSKQARRAAQRSLDGQPSPLPFRTPPVTVASPEIKTSTSSTCDLDTLDLNKVNPFKLFTDEVKNAYLRCSYKWSFHHIPSLLRQVRSESLDIWVMWAILALSIRFVSEPPAPFQTPIEASNAYAAHTRQLLQMSLESPSLSRLQALLMIVGHSWGAGDGAKAWMYLGTAVRMVQVLGLCEELPLTTGRAPNPEDFIHAEERRRVAWTCFLMDSLLSGGHGRKRSLGGDDMRIQLPCERDYFYFGEAVKCEWIHGTISHAHLPAGELGIVAHSMRAADFWGEVARWACSSIVKEELPWDRGSQYQKLLQRIEQWKASLPPRLHYSVSSLHSHSAIEQGQAYIYMWAIYDMAKLFLHRAYLPVLGQVGLNYDREIEQATNGTSEGFGTASEWQYWLKHSRRELFLTAATICDMLEEMRAFGVFFLRGLVPWIGFTIYTAVGVMLYCYNFPADNDDSEIIAKAKSRVMNGCSFLREMKAWPMADTWFETIKRMQAYYQRLKSKGMAGVSLDERENFKNSLVDYGHLQSPSVEPSPKASNSSAASPFKMMTPDRSTAALQSPTSVPIMPTYHNNDNGIMPAPQSQIADNPQQYMQEATAAFWDASTPFEFNYDLDVADFDAIMGGATQSFWEDFPGEASFQNFPNF